MKKSLELIFVALISIVVALSFVPSATKVIDKVNPWSNGFDNTFGCNTEDITNMYAEYVEQWKKEISDSFDFAEEKIYNVKPNPDDIDGPNPDPDKCACKGSGWITHGDGHKTPCPYHAKQMKPLLISEE
tara:strand:- start:87 stop:476 length:390 start_codon:yes stop_codon:yes gene_type:complete